jgi:7-cyano-7-deazaguanine reductase|tara:strand:+ start:312 stop:824 length:513 start_codon:yes stop_codon:yes gene_type:complete
MQYINCIIEKIIEGFLYMKSKINDLKNLGKDSLIPLEPDNNILEKVGNPKIGVMYSVRFICPEFTSLCPVTGQPDFGHLIIDYVPYKYLVESKSLKLYLLSFRNHGAFHEDCSITIAQEIVNLLNPKWLRIGAYWYPRGGIPIDVFWQTGKPPKDLFLPDQDFPLYKGRG